MQIVSIQILRALAAAMVAFGHAQHDAALIAERSGLSFERLYTLPWGAGVDLFFVISGFIMVHASGRLFGTSGARRDFLTRRIARIVPLYWAFTTIYLAYLIIAFMQLGRPMPGLFDVLASYLFVPNDRLGTGFPQPIYALGWTLQYEMFFYLVFASFLTLERNRAVLGCGLLLFGLALAGSIFSPSATILAFATSPIVLEFALGMLVGIAHASGLRLGIASRVVLATGAILVLWLDPMRSGTQALDWTTPLDFARVLSWGVPAAILVAVATLAKASPAELGPMQRGAVALGDASYALYLVHPLAIFAVHKSLSAAGAVPVLGLWPLVGASLALSTVAAVMIHKVFERPATELCRAWLSRPVRRSVPAASRSPSV